MYTGNSYTLADGTEVVINCEKGEGKDGYGVGSDCSATGYYIKKYWDNTYHATLYSGLNPILIRYADILLLRAEALNKQQRQEEALELLNMIRERAGLSLKTMDDFTNASDRTLAMEDAILQERQLELLGEGRRWFD